ncbi:NADPH-dependent FMN reductase [Lederbergia lenta]|uniref:NADPH-dependent FMN reductase n=1 Tax=Lederbergia lenta TaxID=1467 RepID=A0A2X4VMS8_LEDLE|nr:NADPH-dependent FMN reductase [Lederbergia lenta]MCM3112732.1 NAD(P)H-dependent oxidoreductase [Lederbergia lenta]MEC2323766.1 NAD(P)H-dependent oxidoreductase [Lederbergia lenta]SQI51479.1 NADPH-dependent FMN reductase [Lederbergia lenta]
MKIVAIVGSIREDSYNKKLASFMKEHFKNRVEIAILPIEEIPMYNQDNELMPPDIVKDIKSKIAASDGMLIVTPEYNHSIPGVLKNAIDWFSRVDKVMHNKPVMIVGGSGGALGTVRAQMQLRQILNAPGVSALTLPGNEVFIGSVHEKIDESGDLIHEPTIEFLDTVMEKFMDWIQNNNK